MDSARRVDTWRHGGGLYLEHIAAAKLTSGHDRKRQAYCSSKGCCFWGLRFVTLTQTRRRSSSMPRELQGAAGVVGGCRPCLLQKAERKDKRAKDPGGGLLLRGVIALGPGSDASGRRGADRSRRKPRREEGKKATCSDRRFG